MDALCYRRLVVAPQLLSRSGVLRASSIHSTASSSIGELGTWDSGPQALVCGAFAPLDSAKHGTMLSFVLLHNPVHVGMQGLTELM